MVGEGVVGRVRVWWEDVGCGGSEEEESDLLSLLWVHCYILSGIPQTLN